MASPLSWSPGPAAPSNDPNELLRLIERNTAETLWWMKILVGAVVVLVLVTISLYF